MRRSLLKISLMLSLCLISSCSKDTQVDVEELTIEQIQNSYRSGTLTSVQLVKSYLKNIEDMNLKGPALRAVIMVNPDALDIAKKLDEERESGKVRGPMHGIPVLIKDNINTADPMATTAGSLALKNNFATDDAPLIAALRASGAIILGKANLSEWANFRSVKSSSGWSGVGGQVKNPYILTATPCGSSAGSAVAVAANLTAVAIGTETDGSILCPAAYNGIVGLKPTVGLVSRTGVVPIAETQDTAGPMARTVADVAALLTAIVSKDQADPRSMMQPNIKLDYVKFLNDKGLEGKRIGVLRSSFNHHPKLDAVFNKSLKILEEQGAILIDDLEFPTPKGSGKNEYEVLLYEFKHYLNVYLKNTPDRVKVKSLADLIEFNRNNKAAEMPYFNQEIFLSAEEKGPLTDQNYVKALQNSHEIMKVTINKFMADHNLDLIVSPTTNPATSMDIISGDHFTGSSYSKAAISGYPSITVPMGFIHELPVGLTFVTKAYGEDILIEAAYAYEQKSRERKAPKFKKSQID